MNAPRSSAPVRLHVLPRIAVAGWCAMLSLFAVPAVAQLVGDDDLRGSLAQDEPAASTGTRPLFEPAADPWAEARRPLSTALERRREREIIAPVSASATPGDEDEAEPESAGLRTRPSNERVAAIEAIDRRAETDPYAPVGIRLGLFQLFPSLEQGIAWTSNAEYSQDKQPAWVSETTLRLSGQSDWSRHSAAFSAFATLRKSVAGHRISDPSAGFDGRLRLDLADDYAATARLAYALRRETATSAVVIPGVVAQPMMHQFTGELGIARETGKLRLALTGSLQREIFEDAELIGGGVLDQGDRDATLATAVLRIGYEVSPALVPFVEAEIGRRRHDRALDAAGYARSANRLGLRAGIAFDLGEKFSGEVSGGWLTENPEDDRLAAISGISAAAAVEWSPVRGTDLRLDLDTTVEGSTLAGSTGSLLYSAQLGIARQVRANLTATLGGGLALRDYGDGGQEWLANAGAGFTWWMNRNLGLTGRANYQTVRSDLPGRSTDTTTFFLGVNLRR